MEAAHDRAEPNTDEMRQEIDNTRSDLADKLEALEGRVMGTVHSAQETVEDSLQMAKDTVATVQRNFDIKYQVRQHPWVMVGGSFFVGLALGSLFLKVRRRPSSQASDHLAGNETPLARIPRPFADGSYGSLETHRPQSLSAARPGFFGQFQEDIDKVKGMAISYVMGLARDSIKDAVPQLASQIDELVNSVATKLGSTPVQQRSMPAA